MKSLRKLNPPAIGCYRFSSATDSEAQKGTVGLPPGLGSFIPHPGSLADSGLLNLVQ